MLKTSGINQSTIRFTILSTSLLSVLLVVLGNIETLNALDSPDIEECPKPHEVISPCVNKTQTITREYYKVQSGKCKRHFSHETTACEGGVKKKCPLIRFVSHGKCFEGFQKTLVVRYKWNAAEGVCKKHGEFIGQVCDTKILNILNNNTCPTPVYFEKPCVLDLRPVFMIFYEKVGKKCSKRIRYTSEPCAIFNKNHKCPDREMKIKGPCDKEGFQYVLWKSYRYKDKGNCRPVNKMTLEKCKLSEGCPEPKVIRTFNECIHGERQVLKSEYKMVQGRCHPQIVINFEPCGKSLIGECSKTRFIQKGVCEANGKRKFLISHYEKKLDKICRRTTSFIERDCDEKDPFSSDEGCPVAKHHQYDCTGEFRKILRDYYVKDKTGHCHKHRELSYEPCHDTLKNNECPYKEHKVHGPCVDGFATISTYSYTKDDAGCHQHVTKTHALCN